MLKPVLSVPDTLEKSKTRRVLCSSGKGHEGPKSQSWQMFHDNIWQPRQKMNEVITWVCWTFYLLGWPGIPQELRLIHTSHTLCKKTWACLHLSRWPLFLPISFIPSNVFCVGCGKTVNNIQRSQYMYYILFQRMLWMWSIQCNWTSQQHWRERERGEEKRRESQHRAQISEWANYLFSSMSQLAHESLAFSFFAVGNLPLLSLLSFLEGLIMVVLLDEAQELFFRAHTLGLCQRERFGLLSANKFLNQISWVEGGMNWIEWNESACLWRVCVCVLFSFCCCCCCGCNSRGEVVLLLHPFWQAEGEGKQWAQPSGHKWQRDWMCVHTVPWQEHEANWTRSPDEHL